MVLDATIRDKLDPHVVVRGENWVWPVALGPAEPPQQRCRGPPPVSYLSVIVPVRQTDMNESLRQESYLILTTKQYDAMYQLNPQCS